jgi:hypothetical protein
MDEAIQEVQQGQYANWNDIVQTPLHIDGLKVVSQLTHSLWSLYHLQPVE